VKIKIASNSQLCYVRFIFHLFETSSILQRYLPVTLKYLIKKIVLKRSHTHFKIVHPFIIISFLFFTIRKLTSFNDHLGIQNALRCLVDNAQFLLYPKKLCVLSCRIDSNNLGLVRVSTKYKIHGNISQNYCI
jgi:hypothetical protein